MSSVGQPFLQPTSYLIVRGFSKRALFRKRKLWVRFFSCSRNSPNLVSYALAECLKNIMQGWDTTLLGTFDQECTNVIWIRYVWRKQWGRESVSDRWKERVPFSMFLLYSLTPCGQISPCRIWLYHNLREYYVSYWRWSKRSWQELKTNLTTLFEISFLKLILRL